MPMRRPHMVPLRTMARTPGWSGKNDAAGNGSGAGALDRGSLVRRLERQRRVLARRMESRALPPELFVRLTCSSFALEGMPVNEAEVVTALAGGADRRSLRPPHSLRIRNHVAILRSVERNVRQGEELKARGVLRWYTSISCGLSIAGVDEARYGRLEECLRRLNSPRMRIPQAVVEVASVHTRFLAEPLFPGFNGIVARLVLQYHLARCQLPPVVLDPQRDRGAASDTAFADRLLELVGESYRWLLGRG